jgi:recombination associated protein RdgC
MFLKNAQIYKLSDKFELIRSELDEKLMKHHFSPCGQQQPVSIGWVPPVEGGVEMTVMNEGNFLMCMKRQERLLPSSVVSEVLQEKVESIRINEDRRVGSKERQTLKDEVIFSLLPKAFVRTTRHYLYIDTNKGFVVVDSSSDSRADEITSFLRECLGSLPATLMQSHCQPAALLTSWLNDQDKIPSDWELLPEIEFINSQNTDIKVKLKNLELDEEIIRAHINQGARVQSIRFNWNDRITAKINAKAQLKTIRFSDALSEQAMEQSGDDKQSQFQATFIIMCSEINRLIADMVKLFGIKE